MDEHSCGKCGNLFSSIEDFIEHKRVSCTSTPKSPPSVIDEKVSSNPRKNGHVCEICGFEPKSGTKSRERLEHMARKHFKARIDRELSQSSGVNTCPLCEYVGKCKQELIRHYTRRHKVLERYLVEDKLENGIYHSWFYRSKYLLKLDITICKDAHFVDVTNLKKDGYGVRTHPNTVKSRTYHPQ